MLMCYLLHEALPLCDDIIRLPATHKMKAGYYLVHHAKQKPCPTKGQGITHTGHREFIFDTSIL